MLTQLATLVGEDYVATAMADRELASHDVHRRGELPIAVVKPATTDEVCAVVRTLTTAGIAVFVRGGGMSYTDAYLPDRNAAVILDTGRLRAIREINSEDLYVTVESGCTWAELDNALKPYNVRTTFWGAMSGAVSTVGGAMAQGAVTFGSARNGPSMAAAIGLELVVADGSIVVTGSAGQPGHTAFYRHYGPDLTGLFCGDCGALGIKTAITLRLEPRPAVGAGVSFSFPDFESLLSATRLIAREGLATEIFGAETGLIKYVAGPPDLRNDFKQWLTILRGAPNVFAAIKSGIRVALNGRRFLNESKFLVNYLTEAADSDQLRRNLGRVRALVGEQGVEVGNTMAEFTRAMPFPEPALLGPGGLRLLPLHGVVAYSRCSALDQEFASYYESVKSECDALGVRLFVVYAACESAGFLYEVVIYWPGDWPSLARETMSAETLATLSESATTEPVAELVERVRVETIEIMYRHGATHFQIGRAYPYSRDRDAGALAIVRDIKNKVDPDNLINPGVLGL